jgi:hypothetical protein
LLATLLQGDDDDDDDESDWLPLWAERPQKVRRVNVDATTSTAGNGTAPAPAANTATASVTSTSNVSSSSNSSSEPTSNARSPIIWHPATDKSTGDTYYYDPLTKKTVWDLPPGDQLYVKEQALARPTHANSQFRPGAAIQQQQQQYTSASNTSSSSSSSFSSSSSSSSPLLTEVQARKLGKNMANNFRGLSSVDQQSLMKMHTVDQGQSIADTMKIRHEMESKLEKDPSLLDSDSTANFGKVWNRKSGEFGDAIRVGMRSKSKHQIHSLVSDAIELRRKIKLAGGEKRKRHSGNKYGW